MSHSGEYRVPVCTGPWSSQKKVMPDYGSGVKMIDKASCRNKVGSRAERRDSVKPAAATVRAKINLKTLAASSLFPRSRI